MPWSARDDAEALLPRVAPYLEDIQRRKQAFDRRPTEPVAAEIRALVRTIAEDGPRGVCNLVGYAYLLKYTLLISV